MDENENIVVLNHSGENGGENGMVLLGYYSVDQMAQLDWIRWLKWKANGISGSSGILFCGSNGSTGRIGSDG